MGGKANLISRRFGSLVVVELLEITKSGRLWRCVCDCGGEARKITSQLNRHPAIGCRRCEPQRRAAIHIQHGDARGDRNGGKQRLYVIWKEMRTRCYNKNDSVYKYYGAKGVKICDEWSNYPAFRWLALMNGYHNELVIDRLNPDGDYHPDNCEWVTGTENTRRMMVHHRAHGTGIFRKREAS